MQTAALAELAARDPRFGAWYYVAVDCPPAQLAAALPLLRARGFRGLNLTVPHKVLAVELVAAIDPAAAVAGAVNTLRWEKGGWKGFNTDGYGLAQAVRADLGLELAGTPVILAGAGGAARGAAVACLRAGCAALWVVNRSPANLAALLEQVRPLAGRVPLAGLGPDDPLPGFPPGTLLINATSAGLRPTDPPPVVLERLAGVTAVYDMIYNPARTRLLEQAAALGLRTQNGLGMLVHQGAKALELWTGAPAADLAPVMAAAAAKALGAAAAAGAESAR